MKYGLQPGNPVRHDCLHVAACAHPIVALFDAVAAFRVDFVEGEVGKEVHAVAHAIALRQHRESASPQRVLRGCLVPERVAAFGRVDGAERIELAAVHQPRRHLAGGVPPAVVPERGDGQRLSFGKAAAPAASDVQPAKLLVVEEWPVGEARLASEKSREPAAGAAGRTQAEDDAAGVEAAAVDADERAIEEVARPHLHGRGSREVAELGKVRALVEVDALHRLGDEEVQVGVALAVRVADQVHGHPVDRQRDVRAVIGVEASDQILVGLSAAGMLRDDQARHRAKHVGRRLDEQIAIQLLPQRHARRRRSWRRADHLDVHGDAWRASLPVHGRRHRRGLLGPRLERRQDQRHDQDH